MIDCIKGLGEVQKYISVLCFISNGVIVSSTNSCVPYVNRMPLNPTKNKNKYMVLRGLNQRSNLRGLSIKINGIPFSQIGNTFKEESI